MLNSLNSKNLNKYRVEIICLILFLCLIIRLFVPAFAIFTFMIANLAILLECDVKGIYYIGFLYCFRFIFRFKSSEIYFYVFLILFWLLIMTVRYFVDKKYKQKRFWVPIVFLLGFVLYIFIPRNGLLGMIGAIKVSIVLISGYFLYVYGDSVNVKKFTHLYIASIMLSSLLGMFKDIVPQLDQLINVKITYNYETRFMGLDRDPNFYTVSLLVSMASLMVLYMKGVEKASVLYLIVTIILCFGFSTLSKSFILGALISIGVFCLFIVRQKKQNSWNDITLMVVCLLLSSALCYSKIILIFSRFDISISSFKLFVCNSNLSVTQLLTVDRSILDSFTTGRVKIWKDYVSYLLSEPISLLFGAGFNGRVNNRASHNTIIQSLYSIGLIGTIYLAIIFIKLLKEKNKKGREIHDYLPLVIFFILSMGLDFLVSTSVVCYLIMTLNIINYEYHEDDYQLNLINYVWRKNDKK